MARDASLARVRRRRANAHLGRLPVYTLYRPNRNSAISVYDTNRRQYADNCVKSTTFDPPPI